MTTETSPAFRLIPGDSSSRLPLVGHLAVTR